MAQGLLRGNRPFTVLWLARTASYAGDFVTLTALVLYLYQHGATGIQMGIALAARALPQALGPLAGTLADRWQPRPLMIGCDLGRAVTIGIIALALPPIPVLIVLIALSSTLSTFFLPAGKSCVPMLVQREKLAKANGLLGTSHNVSLALGPLLGAALMNWAGPQAAFGVDAASYLLSAVLLLLLPARLAAGRATRQTSIWADLISGMRYVAGHWVARTVALALFFTVLFAAMDNVALVYLIRGELGGSQLALGVAAGVYGTAMIAAPLLIATSRRQFTGMTLLASGVALSGIGLTAMWIAAPLAVAIACYAIAGAGNGFENVGCDTAIGENVDEAMLGRVFGAVYGPIFLSETAAALLGGALLTATDSRTVFGVAGAGLIVVTLIVIVTIRARQFSPDRPA
ncbi:MAG TPA: MFS transporter [Candidatus Limnocylindrales bacterium]|nr:MFS transporter [Candidatus Limnocylindrales bacterium]